MSSLSLKHIYKVYSGGVKAVNDFSMDIEDKEFIVFVGPSGCGKSTTLRMIAGLEDITAGELRIDDVVVNDFEPKDRNIAMVFQNYALYPHMSVYDNMAYSLKIMKLSREEIHEKVLAAAEILGITEYLDRKPKALSGGQRQRVALGRAIVRNPKVFLLDEPLSNLDAKLRTAMRAEITRLHEKLGTTFIYVTHDQVEAMTMGTRIVVMERGYVQQIDTPQNLYKYPENMFVAGFIGTPQMNFLPGVMVQDGDNARLLLDNGLQIEWPFEYLDRVPYKYFDGKRRVVFGIRPEDCRLVVNFSEEKRALYSIFEGYVSVVERLGGETLIYANTNPENIDDEKTMFVVKEKGEVLVARGQKVSIGLFHKNLHVFDEETQRSIKQRLPLENLFLCNVKGDTIAFAGQILSMPAAMHAADQSNVDLIIPTNAVTLVSGGENTISATLLEMEDVGKKKLYKLRLDDENIIFAVRNEAGELSVGDKVLLTVDMKQLTVKTETPILPLNLTNTLNGNFQKIKESVNGRKIYNFYLNFGGSLLPAHNLVCQKLFACKGTKTFSISMQYIFDARSVILQGTEQSSDDSFIFQPEKRHFMTAKVLEVYDYDVEKYALCALSNGDKVILPYHGESEITFAVDQMKLTIKDSALDIIIV